MASFFRGWKRKVGVVGLVLACVLMVAWVRSTLVKDHLTQNYGNGSSIQATAFDSHVGLVVRTGFSRTGKSEVRWLSSRLESIHEWAKERGGWDTYRLGMGAIHQEFEGGSLKAWFIHLGLITLPLTLISACLLLSKTRQS